MNGYFCFLEFIYPVCFLKLSEETFIDFKSGYLSVQACTKCLVSRDTGAVEHAKGV